MGWTLDVMRRLPGGFRYSMEFLIASACIAFRDERLSHRLPVGCSAGPSRTPAPGTVTPPPRRIPAAAGGNPRTALRVPVAACLQDQVPAPIRTAAPALSRRGRPAPHRRRPRPGIPARGRPARPVDPDPPPVGHQKGGVLMDIRVVCTSGPWRSRSAAIRLRAPRRAPRAPPRIVMAISFQELGSWTAPPRREADRVRTSADTVHPRRHRGDADRRGGHRSPLVAVVRIGLVGPDGLRPTRARGRPLVDAGHRLVLRLHPASSTSRSPVGSSCSSGSRSCSCAPAGRRSS